MSREQNLLVKHGPTSVKSETSEPCMDESYLHFCEDGCSVVGDDHFTFLTLDHLVHATRAETCAHSIRNGWWAIVLFIVVRIQWQR
jgi:hypothetical protein